MELFLLPHIIIHHLKPLAPALWPDPPRAANRRNNEVGAAGDEQRADELWECCERKGTEPRAQQRAAPSLW